MSLLGFWRRHYRDIPRVRQIILVASRHGFGHLIEQLGLQRFVSLGRRMLTLRKGPSHPGERRTAPERLRLMFEELGPSFIKLGQVLSCRPDLLPVEYANELSKLTDSVSPFPFEQAREIIEQDLGAPLTALFLEFDPVPVAAASIAQVHKATLLDGNEVMVKVQRPHIERIIDRDISILQGIAELMESYVPEMAVHNPRGIVAEFSRTIHRELDFFTEAANANRLRHNFEGSTILAVPKVYSDLTTRHVLVLDRVEGIRINDLERIDRVGYDRREITNKGASAYFKMVFQDGFFHGDPHPGNIFILPDGRIALVDFGIMGRVTEENMKYFADIIIAIVERDFDKLVEQYVNFGFLTDQTVDLEQLRKELKDDLGEFLEPYYSGMTIRQVDLGAYLERLTRISIRFRLRMPQNLYLVNKTLLTIEGILRHLDPDFNLIETAEPYVKKLIRKQKDPRRALKAAWRGIREFQDIFSTVSRQSQTLIRKMARDDVRINVRHEELDRFIRDVDKSSNRLSFSILTAAIIIASSLIIHSGLGQTILGFPVLGVIGYIIAAILGFWLLIGILRSGQL
jgi:ubiquinone biosynthesis protein